jgi:hypothetical protein
MFGNLYKMVTVPFGLVQQKGTVKTCKNKAFQGNGVSGDYILQIHQYPWPWKLNILSGDIPAKQLHPCKPSFKSIMDRVR